MADKDIPILDVDYHLREYDTRPKHPEFGYTKQSYIEWQSERIEQLIQGPGGIMEMKQTIADKEAELHKCSMLYSQRVEQLYLLDSYTDGIVGEIESGASIERLQELAKIYRYNKKEGLY